MYIKEAHILIEQKLQNIGAFVHSDIDPQEVDLHIKAEMWKMLETDFPEPKGTKINKPKIDKYSVLLEKDIEFAVNKNSRGNYEIVQPNNFFHYVKVSAVVLYECSKVNIVSGKLSNGEYYRVLNNNIIYNNLVITANSIFKADSSNAYIFQNVNKKAVVIKLDKRISPTRLIEEEFTDAVNDNALTRTKVISPIVNVGNKKIFVLVDNFFIEKIYFSYLKEPVTPNKQFKTFGNADALQANTAYEVIEGSITYNGIQYSVTSKLKPVSFTTTGSVSFTGGGKVRIKGDGDIELPYQICLKVIDAVVLVLSASSEVSANKIQALAATSTKY